MASQLFSRLPAVIQCISLSGIRNRPKPRHAVNFIIKCSSPTMRQGYFLQACALTRQTVATTDHQPVACALQSNTQPMNTNHVIVPERQRCSQPLYHHHHHHQSFLPVTNPTSHNTITTRVEHVSALSFVMAICSIAQRHSMQLIRRDCSRSGGLYIFFFSEQMNQ